MAFRQGQSNTKGVCEIIVARGPLYLQIWLCLGANQKTVAKRWYNWSSGLIPCAFGTLLRAGPVWRDLGDKLVREAGSYLQQ